MFGSIIYTTDACPYLQFQKYSSITNEPINTTAYMDNINERDDPLWIDWVFIDCFWEYSQTLTSNDTNMLKYFFDNVFGVHPDHVNKLDNDIICDLSSTR